MSLSRQVSAMSPTDDSTPAGTPGLLQDPSDQTKSFSPIVNRVCTPLGLFMEPSSKHQGMRMPQTLTPDSTQPSDSSPRHPNTNHDGSPPIPTQHQPNPSSRSAEHMPADIRIPPLPEPNARPLPSGLSSPSKTSDVDMSPSTNAGEIPPLHTGSVRASTKIAHPKPVSRGSSVVKSRPGTAMSSVAQLEATAERLSLTSSIDNAIRDLHGEMKRSDSRRSSILAANVKAASEEAASAANASANANSQILRHLSTSSSIVSTNIAARHGGYSPAAFVMSPATSHSARLPTTALPPTSNPDGDLPTMLARHGPGKSSVRSVRSSKLSLADISESEPTSLTQDVLDEADAAPPVEEEEDYIHTAHQHVEDNSPMALAADAYPRGSAQIRGSRSLERDNHPVEAEGRPGTSNSQDTFHQAQHAFYDFDGVHCAEDYHSQYLQRSYEQEIADEEPSENESLLPPGAVSFGVLKDEEEAAPGRSAELEALQDPEIPPAIPRPRPAPAGMKRPQSYVDQTGVQMLYYPARVPAQLNLPQKLSSKPKAARRNSRQQKVLSAMLDGSPVPSESVRNEPKRSSAMPDLGPYIAMPEDANPVPLLERHSDPRASYISLPAEEYMHDTVAPAEDSDQFAAMQGQETRLADTLRVPQRLTRTSHDKHKSRAPTSSAIPSHLRASAYFDQPSTLPEVQLTNGSAMSTLDSILDASASAPVGAFTDHLYAGKLGSEVYGKAARPSSITPATSQEQLPEREVKKRSSFMWRSKRSTSYNSEADRSYAESINGAADSPRSSNRDGDGENVIRVPAGPIEKEDAQGRVGDEEEDASPDYTGAPTTLLAEIQLRKQQQKDRLKTRITNAGGTHATLLELDAIAETQRVDRKSKRIALAWEDPAAHIDQNGSDDEDVPLAVIAAKHQGAKNMADMERPIGLIERREIEENETLAQRRARLQGRDVSLNVPRPPSAMRLSPSRLGDAKPAPSVLTHTPDPVEGDMGGETLADRRRRLASNDELANSLPATRPVSRAFSAELLSQFGDLDEVKDEPARDEGDAEEETLGQRRRRLQAEKAARNHEMSFSNAAGAPTQTHSRKVSLSSMLAANPRKSPDLRVQEEMRMREEEERVTRERDAKMAAVRLQMPSTLSIPSYGARGGYLGGAYNDGSGGNARRPRPVSAHVAQATGYPQHSGQGSGAFNSGYQQTPYGGMNPYPMANTQPYGAPGMYNAPSMSNYGMPMQPSPMQMPMLVKNGSMDRVEMWRQGVQP